MNTVPIELWTFFVFVKKTDWRWFATNCSQTFREPCTNYTNIVFAKKCSQVNTQLNTLHMGVHLSLSMCRVRFSVHSIHAKSASIITLRHQSSQTTSVCRKRFCRLFLTYEPLITPLCCATRFVSHLLSIHGEWTYTWKNYFLKVVPTSIHPSAANF